MKSHLYLWILFLTAAVSPDVTAQITVSYPLENSVFQRDAQNHSTVYIAGNFHEFLDAIEVKFTPVRGGWGQESGWMVIESNPKNGYYSSSAEWSGGWYRLEVRGKRGDQVIGAAAVNKVGIGEVFLIAGQSNGEGRFNSDAPSASDERVVHADYDGIFGPNAPLPYPSFSQLQANDIISPRGKSAWFWGKLGDALAGRLNVPVLFYNVAWDGSGIQAWRESINGIAWSAYNPSLPFEPVGMPFGNFRNVMLNYIAITGIRAVLWIQGEADNDVGTSSDTYYASLETVINRSRSEFNRNLSWVVARVSYTGRAGYGSGIINAQNRVISNLSNVFAGPEMDQVQVPRPDGYHLSGSGLSAAADAWSQALSNEFFSNSVPHKSKAPIPVFTACHNGSLTIYTEGAFHGHRWNNGSQQAELTAGEGTYQVSAYDPEGNYRFSPRFHIPGNIGALTPPSVSSVGPAEVCLGGSLTLVSSSDRNPVWNTGQTGREIQISAPGDYHVTIENVYGCRSSSPSFNVARSGKQLPTPPVITADRATEICQGEEVRLSSNTGNNTYWSTGAGNQATIGIGHSGQFTARTRDSEGCYSENSGSISIQVNPLPAKPNVTANNPLTFCDGGEVTLQSSYEAGNTWSNNSTDRSIVIRHSGQYQVSVTDDKGCKNSSDPLTVTVNPLPAPPVLTALRSLTFCEGDYTTLTSDPQHSYTWNTGAQSREITIRQAGSYFVTATDHNGCKSGSSNVLSTTVHPLPARPAITTIGSTTFCENSSVLLEAPDAPGYLWSNGNTDRRQTINVQGAFTVQVSNQFGCYSPRSESVSTRTIAIPTPPTVTVTGPSEVCDGTEVRLTARGSSPFVWNTGETTSSILVRESGDYSAQSVGQNNCTSNPSNSAVITVQYTPERPVLDQRGMFSLQVLNDMPGVSYNWINNSQPLPDLHSANIRVSESGGYSAQAFVTYSEVLTCFSDYSDQLTHNIPATSHPINVFPNPSRGPKVLVETSQVLSRALVSVYSLQGVLIHSSFFDIISLPVEIEIPPGTSGIYIVKVTANNFEGTKKLVVAH